METALYKNKFIIIIITDNILFDPPHCRIAAKLFSLCLIVILKCFEQEIMWGRGRLVEPCF